MTDTATLPLPRPSSSTHDDVTNRDVERAPDRPRQARRLLVAAVFIGVVVVLSTWAGQLFPGSTALLLGSADTSNGRVSEHAALTSRATGEDGGVLANGTSPFDIDLPGVAGLDPSLLDALQRAAVDASADDVDIVVNSGWRSAAYQEQLLKDAVSQYGTPEEAARWVATPATSAHVHGDAVDVGYWDATTWLSEHGADYDLCQIYMNETWHYELSTGAAVAGCPPMFRDPTVDPRMQQ